MSPTDGRRPLLATVGDNCIDHLVHARDGREMRLVGGNAVNVAVQARRASLATAYFGAVGADDDGALVRHALRREGVDEAGLVIRPGRTSVTRIDVRRDGERLIAAEDFGVCRGYYPTPDDIARILRADHVHLGWIDDAGALRRRLVAEGRSVSQDLSVNAEPGNLGVEGLAIAFGSCPGDLRRAERLARDWLARGARMAVVTRGAEGALIVAGGEAWEIGAEEVDPLDTTGAGDAFIAGFLASRLRGGTPSAAGAAGARHARDACLHEGGFPQSDHT